VNTKPTLADLIEEVLELPNTVTADLETGSHHWNNAAAKHFNKEYPLLVAHINKLVQLAAQLREEVT
jgi:hypothetical protein